jgi:hypothetical protein
MSESATAETLDALQDSVDALVEKADLGLHATRRVPAETLIREVFLLEKEDLVALKQEGPQHTSAGLKHIRAFHKVVALRLALGEKPVEICANLSITPQTISRLSKDEQFKELVGFYQEKLSDKAIDLAEMMSVVGFEALTALHERLVGDERDAISIESLRKIGVDYADRTGHSPVRRAETLNRNTYGIDGETLAKIKLQRAENARLVEGELVRAHEKDSKDSGATKSLTETIRTLSIQAPKGIECEGEGV